MAVGLLGAEIWRGIFTLAVIGIKCGRLNKSRGHEPWTTD
jgi:hypothetical protein